MISKQFASRGCSAHLYCSLFVPSRDCEFRSSEGDVPSDRYFAVSMRYLNKYVNENALNFTTPADVVFAFKNGAGISNTT